MKNPVTAMVVPSNRIDQFQRWYKAWRSERDWDFTVLVEDGNPSHLGVPVDLHLSWNDVANYNPKMIALLVSDALSIFSRSDSAIRCIGFLKAVELGADVVITMDDDCTPMENEHISKGHTDALARNPKWVSSVPGKRVRGIPYGLECYEDADDVKINMGLWAGILDYDAPTQLSQYPPVEEYVPAFNNIIPPGTYFPMCGMNLAFRREALPLMYFPLMGKGQPFSRFDDIWCGIIAKKICDHLGWRMRVGSPTVYHNKASDVFVNLKKEAPGIAANEEFWKIIDAAPLTKNTACECMAEMATHLINLDDIEWNQDHLPNDYLHTLSRCLSAWSSITGDILNAN